MFNDIPDYDFCLYIMVTKRGIFQVYDRDGNYIFEGRPSKLFQKQFDDFIKRKEGACVHILYKERDKIDAKSE